VGATVMLRIALAQRVKEAFGPGVSAVVLAQFEHGRCVHHGLFARR